MSTHLCHPFLLPAPPANGIGGSHALNHKCHRDKAKELILILKLLLNFAAKAVNTNLMKASTRTRAMPTAHPARLKTEGSVRAPVPTMRLNTYTKPV